MHEFVALENVKLNWLKCITWVLDCEEIFVKICRFVQNGINLYEVA